MNKPPAADHAILIETTTKAVRVGGETVPTTGLKFTVDGKPAERLEVHPGETLTWQFKPNADERRSKRPYQLVVIFSPNNTPFDDRHQAHYIVLRDTAPNPPLEVFGPANDCYYSVVLWVEGEHTARIPKSRIRAVPKLNPVTVVDPVIIIRNQA